MNKKYVMMLLGFSCVGLQASQDGSQSDDRSLSDRYVQSHSSAASISPVPSISSAAASSLAPSPFPSAEEMFENSPKTQAVFTAIKNGADEEFVQILLRKALELSPSPGMEKQMIQECLRYYREESPQVVKLRDPLIYNTLDAAGKAAFRDRLDKFLEYYTSDDN